MKDHKEESRNFDLYDLENASLEDAILRLRSSAEGLLDPKINIEYGYEGIESFKIKGWIPLTPSEIEKKNKKDKKALEARRKARVTQLANRKKALLKEAQRLGYKLVNEFEEDE